MTQNECTLANRPTRAEGHLNKLSELGHFLKGSSATIGLTKVKDGCEKIQHWGSHKDESGNETNESEAELLKRIKDILPSIRGDCAAAEVKIRKFFGLDTKHE